MDDGSATAIFCFSYLYYSCRLSHCRAGSLCSFQENGEEVFYTAAIFLYYVVNQEKYDWWYFPFQLCSLPMYFCLLLPLVKNRKLQLIILTFMQDFNLLGGIMALAEPSGLLHPYWFLTMHGLLWHILLIFIGLFIGFSHESDSSFTGYIRTLPLFLLCCGIATLINVTARPLG